MLHYNYTWSERTVVVNWTPWCTLHRKMRKQTRAPTGTPHIRTRTVRLPVCIRGRITRTWTGEKMAQMLTWAVPIGTRVCLRISCACFQTHKFALQKLNYEYSWNMLSGFEKYSYYLHQKVHYIRCFLSCLCSCWLLLCQLFLCWTKYVA